MTLHVQGGHAARVPDVDGSVTNFTNWSAYAVGQASRVHAPAASLNVTWRSGPKSAVQVLTAMCDADVVIASPSGFSHLVAVLCKRPLILAVPMWLSYACASNVLMLEPTHVVPIRLAALRGEHAKLPQKLRIPDGAAHKRLHRQLACASRLPSGLSLIHI